MKITDKKLIRRVQILDIAMMCLLYIIQACIFGYVMSYLTDKGLTTGQIGFLSAGFGALAAFLQPVLGRISDRSRYFDWKKQLFIISISFDIKSRNDICLNLFRIIVVFNFFSILKSC